MTEPIAFPQPQQKLAGGNGGSSNEDRIRELELDVREIKTRMEGLATKTDIATLRTRMEGLATKTDIATLRNWILGGVIAGLLAFIWWGTRILAIVAGGNVTPDGG